MQHAPGLSITQPIILSPSLDIFDEPLIFECLFAGDVMPRRLLKQCHALLPQLQARLALDVSRIVTPRFSTLSLFRRFLTRKRHIGLHFAGIIFTCYDASFPQKCLGRMKLYRARRFSPRAITYSRASFVLDAQNIMPLERYRIIFEPSEITRLLMFPASPPPPFSPRPTITILLV